MQSDFVSRINAIIYWLVHRDDSYVHSYARQLSFSWETLVSITSKNKQVLVLADLRSEFLLFGEH